MLIGKKQQITGNGTTLVLSGVAAGSMLVLTSSCFNAVGVIAETLPTDSAGTFQTQDKLAADSVGQGNLASIFYEPNAAAGTHTATPQNFGAGSQQRCFAEFTALATTSPLDAKTTAKTENSTQLSQVTGTIATVAQAGQLVVIVCSLSGSPGAANVGWTDPVAGFTTLMKASNDNTDMAGLHAFKVSSAIGSQVATFNWTDTLSNRTSLALIGTYNGAVPAACRLYDGAHRPKPFAPGSPR